MDFDFNFEIGFDDDFFLATDEEKKVRFELQRSIDKLLKNVD